MKSTIPLEEKGVTKMIELKGKEKEKMDKAVEKALKRPYWKKLFDGAPSEECKDYIRYTFYASEYYDPDAEDATDFDKLREQVESRLKAEDWEYLKTVSPNSPFVGYCNQRIKELTKK